MKPHWALTLALAISLWLAGEALGGGRGRAGGFANGTTRGGSIQRYWRPAVPVAPPYTSYYPYPYYPYPYYGHNPRSIIVITPSRYYPYSAPITVLTSEPYYCHMHHVGFVSRIGFLDHISGTHKIPLEAASSICTETNESCIIEGY
jgi:hypothetical protein